MLFRTPSKGSYHLKRTAMWGVFRAIESLTPISHLQMFLNFKLKRYKEAVKTIKCNLTHRADWR